MHVIVRLSTSRSLLPTGAENSDAQWSKVQSQVMGCKAVMLSCLSSWQPRPGSQSYRDLHHVSNWLVWRNGTRPSPPDSQGGRRLSWLLLVAT